MNDTASNRSGKGLYAEIRGTVEIPDRTKAMDALIAGDADLYEVDLLTAAERILERGYVSSAIEDEAGDYAMLAAAIASARIKGDKDRLASRAPPLEYDHTQEKPKDLRRLWSVNWLTNTFRTCVIRRRLTARNAGLSASTLFSRACSHDRDGGFSLGVVGVTAIISDCGQYRYWLERQCEGEGATAIIMVNPSTADATQDDATIRKLRGFGNRHKWGRLIVGNLFAYRATDVRELGKVADPIGPDNDYWLHRIAGTVDRVIYAWGPTAKQPRAYRSIRWPRVTGIFHGVDALRIGPPAMCGSPKHPLMLAYDLPLERVDTPA